MLRKILVPLVAKIPIRLSSFDQESTLCEIKRFSQLSFNSETGWEIAALPRSCFNDDASWAHNGAKKDRSISICFVRELILSFSGGFTISTSVYNLHHPDPGLHKIADEFLNSKNTPMLYVGDPSFPDFSVPFATLRAIYLKRCKEGISFKIDVPEPKEGAEEDVKVMINVTPEEEHTLTISNLAKSMTADALEIGGMAPEDLRRLRRVFMTRFVNPEFAKRNRICAPRGMLFYGPPGTGKSFLAHKLALCGHMQIRTLSGSELGSKWYGETEENVRALFAPAIKDMEEAKCTGKMARQHILFIDEIDALAPARDGSTSKSEVTNRVVAQFLSCLDGPDSATNVLVIGTTNRRGAVDEAMLRQGRLSEHFEFKVPAAEERMDIARIHTKHLSILTENPDLLEKYIDRMPERTVGADIKGWTDQIVTQATLHTMEKDLEMIRERSKRKECDESKEGDEEEGSDEEEEMPAWVKADGRLDITIEDIEAAFGAVFPLC